jgi:FAD binding domain
MTLSAAMSLFSSVINSLLYGLLLAIPYIYFMVPRYRRLIRIFASVALVVPTSLYTVGFLNCNASSGVGCLLSIDITENGLKQLSDLTGFRQDGETKLVSTPTGCKVVENDEDFPAPDVWEAAMPGIAHRKTKGRVATQPIYRFTVKSVSDVEKAVHFAAKYNVRLTIITTGHDYLGRNDAPSGLSLDCSQLRGVKVLSHFEATKEGASSVVPNTMANIITSFGNQPAVTFGVGNNGGMVNAAIKESKIFIVTGQSRKCLA